MKDRPKGILIAFFGVMCTSPDAVLTRFLSEGGTNSWTIIFWKALFSTTVSASFAVYGAGGVAALWKSIVVGRRYYAVAVPIAASIDIGFTFSFLYTSAANALLLISLNPLWCAVLGFLFLEDKLPRRTVVALMLALVCMVVLFVPDIIGDSGTHDSGTHETTWIGDIFALFTGFQVAIYISIVRKGGKSSNDIQLTGAAALGGSLTMIISLIVRMGDGLLPTEYWIGDHRELWQYWCGTIAEGGGVGVFRIAMSLAPTLVTGAETGVVLLLEAFFGPIWVFLAYGDAPSMWTLIGGSALLVVLAVHEAWPLVVGRKHIEGDNISDIENDISHIRDSMQEESKNGYDTSNKNKNNNMKDIQTSSQEPAG